MREILFRGKLSVSNGTLHKNEWVYGDYVRLHDGDKITKHFIYGFGEIDMKTLGQFTGRLDKNRKKIFEGDIIRDISGGIYKVVYDTEYIGFAFEQNGIKWCLEGFDSIKDFEVIGNAFDNPKFLEERK